MNFGDHPTPLVVAAVSWQLREEGVDVRPGHHVSWPVSRVHPEKFTWTRERRAVDFMVDTYMAPEDVLPPGFLRIEGDVVSVDVIRRISGGPEDHMLMEPASTTLGPYDPEVDSFIVTLAPGAIVSETDELDHRFMP